MPDPSASSPTPEKAFRRRWARQVVAHAVERLRARAPSADLRLLWGEGPRDLSLHERKLRSRRLRHELRECMREMLLPTVDSAFAAESKIRDVFSALK